MSSVYYTESETGDFGDLYDEQAELDAAWCDRCGVHHSGDCED
jgi:hypothetical protein